MTKPKFFVFENIEPTMAVIEELGFVLVSDDHKGYLYTRDFGGVTGRLGLFWETASWDISDNTWLEFRLGDKPMTKDIWSGSLHFENGFDMRTRNVPTAEQIKAAIINQIKRDNKWAKEKLATAYEAMVAAHTAYQTTTDALKW